MIKKEDNNKVVYSANSTHPMFKVLQSVVRRHLGIENILENIINNIGEVNQIMILGDYSRGIDSGIIEVLIIGKRINNDYLDSIKPKIEKEINRKINFLISSTGTSQEGLVIFE